MSLSAEFRFHAVTLQLTKKLHNILIEIEADGKEAPLPTMMSNIAVSYIEGFKDKKKMINTFIRKSYPFWNKIRKREISFFTDNASTIFNYIPVANLDHIFDEVLKMERSSGCLFVDENEKKKIWGFFDAMVNISIRYAHDNSGPVSRITEGKQIQEYTKNAFEDEENDFPNINIIREAIQSDEYAKKNGTFKQSLRDMLIFPIV